MRQCFRRTARLDSRFRLGEKSKDATTLRHSRESGNPEAAVRNIDPVFITETPRQIPAFAGMTSICNLFDVFTCSLAGMTKYYRRVMSSTALSFRESDRPGESRPISSRALSRERWRENGFLQFHYASLCSAGGFGNVVKARERDPAASETGYAEVSK